MTMQEYSWHIFIVPIVVVGAIMLWTVISMTCAWFIRRDERRNRERLLKEREELLKERKVLLRRLERESPKLWGDPELRRVWAEDIDG